MGVSTDAILAYGFDLGDDNDIGIEIDEERGTIDTLNDILLEKNGLYERWAPKLEGYWERRDKALATLGVEIVLHCSYDYPMVFIAAKGSVTNASRGYPQIITSFGIDPEWDSKLYKALSDLGIIVDSPPAWQLFSMWG